MTNKSETDSSLDSSCSTTGSCLTAQRMCPGIALFIAYVIGHGALYATGSEAIGIGVGIILFITLVTGLHSRMWKNLTRARKKTNSV